MKNTSNIIAEVLDINPKKEIEIITEDTDEYNKDSSVFTVEDLIKALEKLDKSKKIVVHTTEFGANTIKLRVLEQDNLVEIWPW